MARTQPTEKALSTFISSIPEGRRASKTTSSHFTESRKALKTTARIPQTRSAPRSTVSGKTPAHLFRYTGAGGGGRGKTYYPLPPVPKFTSRRGRIVAPPLLPKPIKRGAGVMHEITIYQNMTGHLVPKLPLQRLIREIAAEYSDGIRFTPESLHALQEAAEMYVVRVLRDGNALALHAGRVTLKNSDIQLMLRLREFGY